jgi:predicted  nucleic acid-binding Zn-ribbon protein
MDSWLSHYGVLFLLLVLAVVLMWRSGFFGRLLRIIEEMIHNNWQLALLGATAVALSLASGYTTFDGLRNFTSAPLLSVLIAFGIQGVMLIVAWLIGESFATGMNQQLPRNRTLNAREAVIGMGLGVALVGLVFYWVLSRYNAVGFKETAGVVQGFRADWVRFSDVALYFGLAVLIVAIVAFNFRRGGDISTPYVQSVRIIVRNFVLWVMFLASMAASVFFSFDSHFNAIFPADQKKRAAEIRTLNQVGRVVADIGEEAQRVRLVEADRLFDAAGWKAYDAQLSKLALEAKAAQPDIMRYLIGKMEEVQRGLAEQQERIAGAERGQTALVRRRDEAEAELQRLEPTIGALEAELAKAKSVYDGTRQAIAAKRIDASAEDGGVEGTLKRGKGPVWRQRIVELDELQRKLTITDEPRYKEAQRERDRVSARIVGLKREIATINGEVAKYKGETKAAESRIKAVEATVAGGDGSGRLDPARALPAFERARIAFRQQPDTEKLAALQGQCSSLLGAMQGTPAARERVRGIDCDAKEAADAAGRVFALNAGLVLFQTQCAGGAKLPQSASTDELLSFGRQCLQDSGLTGKEAEAIGVRLQAIDMNRDDKAHRFVVTWNAFLDGNRLAYLALVLAIGVDALVFMAGLFGAAAVKSPLSDVPSPKARSGEQLEAVIDAALLPHSYENARQVLMAMQPMTPRDGYAQRIVLQDVDPQALEVVRHVLNAGSTIGAVREVDRSTYELRSELFEHLSRVAKNAFRADKTRALSAELERIVSVALLPDYTANAEAVLANAETVLQYMHPIEARPAVTGKPDGPDLLKRFSAEIRLNEVPEHHKRVVRIALNAGATLDAVLRHDNSHYLVNSEFYKALVNIRARLLQSVTHRTQEPQFAGSLRERRPEVPFERRDQIEDKSWAQTLGNGHAVNGGSEDADDGLRRLVREHLLTKLGLPSEPLAEHGVPSETGEIVARLKRKLRAHPGLLGALESLEQDHRRSLDEAALALKGEHADDRQALDIIEETRREIGQVVLALMLHSAPDLLEELRKVAEGGGDADRLQRRLRLSAKLLQ